MGRNSKPRAKSKPKPKTSSKPAAKRNQPKQKPVTFVTPVAEVPEVEAVVIESELPTVEASDSTATPVTDTEVATPEQKPAAVKRRRRRPSLLAFIAVSIVLVAAGWGVMVSLPQATGRGINTGYPTKLRTDYAALDHDIKIFEDAQAKAGMTVVSDETLSGQLSSIQLAAAGGHYVAAETNIRNLQNKMKDWRAQLAAPKPTVTPERVADATPAATPNGTFLPVMIYHYTPSDFNAQLNYLDQNGYTVISLASAVAGLSGGKLPAKPVVITFDDGFENQMDAFTMLKNHNMKATFYIINGGESSRWCIGAGRRYGDPLQPASGCGDSYLSWDQVRQLDRSGLISIGGHTLDHPELTTLSDDQQRHEIIDSKSQIETEIGHPIYDFAYPYGNYDATTIGIVRAAGYRSAVTTLSSEYQPSGSQYTLRRVRTTLELP